MGAIRCDSCKNFVNAARKIDGSGWMCAPCYNKSGDKFIKVYKSTCSRCGMTTDPSRQAYCQGCGLCTSLNLPPKPFVKKINHKSPQIAELTIEEISNDNTI